MSKTELLSQKSQCNKNSNVPKLRFPEFEYDWQKKKLGDIGQTFNGLTGKTKEDFGIGKPYIQYTQIFENSKININDFGLVDVSDDENQKTAKYGDVFFTTSSETPTEVGYSSVLLNNIDELYLNSFCFGYRPHSLDELNPDFAQFLFRSADFRKRVVRLAQGSTRYNMSKVQLMKEIINIPSLEEQQKIAACLSSLDDLITTQTQKIDSLKTHKKGLMQQLFPAEGKTTPKLRFSEFTGEWDSRKLGDITDIIMGQSPDSTSYNSDGIGTYLIQGNADIKNKNTSPRIWTNTPTKECKTGDIIMTVRAPVGAIAKSVHNACIGRGVCAIRSNQHSISSYLYQFLLNFENQWVKFEQGSTFTAVNTKDVKSLKLNLPTKPEQQKIAACLSSLDELITLQTQKIESLKTHKKGLMQQLFPTIN